MPSIRPRPNVLMVRIIWNHEFIPLPRLEGFKNLYIEPTADYPAGEKGKALACAWEELTQANTSGIVMLDGDTVIDPLDSAIMGDSITEMPNAVHVAPVRLWPHSTKFSTWVWAHGIGNYTQADVEEIDMFTFNFTYLPRSLMETCIHRGMKTWRYPHVDHRVVDVARETLTPMKLVKNCYPKHLNF